LNLNNDSNKLAGIKLAGLGSASSAKPAGGLMARRAGGLASRRPNLNLGGVNSSEDRLNLIKQRGQAIEQNY
jgi:hypothetical protein